MSEDLMQKVLGQILSLHGDLLRVILAPLVRDHEAMEFLRTHREAIILTHYGNNRPRFAAWINSVRAVHVSDDLVEAILAAAKEPTAGGPGSQEIAQRISECSRAVSAPRKEPT